MEVVPKEVAFAAAKLDAFNRNRYRIETTGATTAGPSSIVLLRPKTHLQVVPILEGAPGRCPHRSGLLLGTSGRTTQPLNRGYKASF